MQTGTKGSDFRAALTYGSGLGRYVSAGFIGGGILNEEGELIAIQSINGFFAQPLLDSQ